MSLPQTADEVAILETREASPSHFLVKFESFSSLGKNGVHKYETGEFSAGGYKCRENNLETNIYPNEDKTGIDSNYLSMYLVISDTASLPASWEVNAVFSFFLFNQISCNYLYSLGRTRRFLPMKQDWGISKFMSKKVLMDPSNGFLIDNNCVFGAEVFIVEKSAVFECLSPKNVTVPYKRVWEISNFSKLGDVWTSEEFVVGGHKWDVSVYPKGKDNSKGRYLSVYLRLIDSKRVKAFLSICIKDQMNYKHNKKTDASCWFTPTQASRGWNSFIELNTLEDPGNGFIVKDCCQLEIELSVPEDEVV